MSWSDRLAGFVSELSDIQQQLLSVTEQLQRGNIGVGELEISAAIYALRQELDRAKNYINQMH